MANTIKVIMDGMEREITLPDYALESTQEKILKALTKGDKTDKESKSALDELVKGATNKAKDDKKAQDEADKDRNAQLDALKSINKNVKATGGTGSDLNLFGKAVKTTGQEVFKFGSAIISGVSTAITSLFVNANNLGQEFGKLQMSGVGLDTAGMSALNLATSLNALGFTTDQALSIMGEYSGVVQTIGRQAFLDVNKQFLNITGSGTKLGLTLDQAADVLAEDLELRQMLGTLQQIDTNRQAKLSAQLFEQQLQATAVLGKSIDDIRGAAKAALADNAQVQLAIQAATAGMDPDAAAKFVMGLEQAAGEMAAVGIDQSLINATMDAALAPVAFMGESGAQLNKALTALDAAAGSSLRAQIQAANAAKQRGDMDEFNRIMNNFDDEMMKAAAALDENDLKQLQIQLPALGPAAEKLGLSIGQLRLANQRLAEGVDASVSPLTESAKAFENAQNQFKGSLNSMMNNISGALGAPMAELASAFSEEVVRRNKFGQVLDKNGDVMMKATDQFNDAGEKVGTLYTPIKDVADLTEEQAKSVAKSNGIFGTFRNAMTKINEAFRKLFNPIEDGSKGIGNLAQIVADKVNPYIARFGDYVSDFISNIKPEDVEAAIDNIVLGLTGLWDAISWAAGAIKSVLGFFVDVDEQEVQKRDENGELVFDDAGNAVMESIKKVDIGGTIINGLMGLFALNMAKKAFSAGMEKGMSSLSKGASGLMSKLFGGGSGAAATASTTASGAGNVASAASGGIGGGIKSLGKGIGKGIGGILKGLAQGLGSLGSGKVLAGIAALAGLGLAMEKTIAHGFKSFVDLDWETMGKAIVGLGALGAVAGVIGLFAPTALLGAAALGAIGLALNLFPVDVLETLGGAFEKAFNGVATVIETVFGGIGDTIGKVSEAINSFKTAGAEAESIKLDAQAAAMERLSAIPTEQILATADAVNALAASMTTFGDAVGSDGMFFDSGADVDKQNEQIGVFAKFAGLDSVAIMSTSDALSAMADSYAKFANIDAEKLTAVSRSMEQINSAVKPSIMDDAAEFVGNALGSVASKLGFGSEPVDNPAPDTQAVATATTAGTEESGAMSPDSITKDALAIINELQDLKKKFTGSINDQTRKSQTS